MVDWDRIVIQERVTIKEKHQTTPTLVNETITNLLVSTVRLPFNHGDETNQLNYETMVYNLTTKAWLDNIQERCATEQEARKQHTKCKAQAKRVMKCQ